MLELVLVTPAAGLTPPELHKAVRTLRSQLGRAPCAWALRLRAVADTTLSAIEDAMRSEPQLVQFTCPDSLQKFPQAAIARLRSVLAARTRVIVLNTGDRSSAATFLNSAECVLALSDPISDSESMGFAARFYRALFDGLNVAEALAAGHAGPLATGSSMPARVSLLTRQGLSAADVRLFCPLRVFSVHTEKAVDCRLADELKNCLGPLARSQLLQYAASGEALPGESVASYRTAELARADIVLPLVSRDLMNDDGILDSIAEVMRQRPELVVVPVILRNTDLSAAPFAGLQSLPRSGSIDSSLALGDLAWDQVTQELKALVVRLQTERNLADHQRLMASSRAPVSGVYEEPQ